MIGKRLGDRVRTVLELALQVVVLPPDHPIPLGSFTLSFLDSIFSVSIDSIGVRPVLFSRQQL